MHTSHRRVTKGQNCMLETKTQPVSRAFQEGTKGDRHNVRVLTHTACFGIMGHTTRCVVHAEPEPMEAREGCMPVQPLHVRLNLAALNEGQRPMSAPMVQESEPR